MINKIGALNANVSKSVAFKAKEEEYENPVSRGTERNLAVWGSLGGAAVLGTLAGGLASCVTPTTKMADEAGNVVMKFLKAKKFPVGIGAAVAAITLAFSLPAKIYNTKVNAFVKQKEMDVFSRDRDLKSNLTEEVGKEVKNPDISLDKKLDDNLKLQMANKGTAIGIANVTPQVQG